MNTKCGFSPGDRVRVVGTGLRTTDYARAVGSLGTVVDHVRTTVYVALDEPVPTPHGFYRLGGTPRCPLRVLPGEVEFP